MSPLRKGISSPAAVKNKFKQAVRKVAALNNISSTMVGSSEKTEQLMIPKSRHMLKSSTLLSNILNNSQAVMRKQSEIYSSN